MSQKGFSLVIIVLLLTLITSGIGLYYWKVNQTQTILQLTPTPLPKKTPTPSSSPNIQSSSIPSPLKKSVEAKEINGDIVIVKDGKETKITSWGHNFDPVLSPDQTKVAYTSLTEQSLKNATGNGMSNFVNSSSNVWIINIDGTNPIQITKHIDAIYRGNLHWIDTSKIIYTEGESSIKLYDLNSKNFKTLLNPDKPVGVCPDACGYEIHFYYSPDFKYLLRLPGGYSQTSIGILDLATLNAQEINQNYAVDFSTIKFSNDNKISFTGNLIENPKTSDFTLTINLKTGNVD